MPYNETTTKGNAMPTIFVVAAVIAALIIAGPLVALLVLFAALLSAKLMTARPKK